MFFDFKFWHFLTNPRDLTNKLQTSEMRGFTKRIWIVFLIGVLLFSLREIWGMGTQSLTPLLSTMTTTDYTLARYASLVGTIIWAIIYLAFHFFGIAYILSLLTGIPFKKLLPLQLLVTGLLLLEKAVIFLVFTMIGGTANVSFLSFGPLAITFLDNLYIVFALNQITITTVLIIVLQSRFIRSYTGIPEKRNLLLILIGIHLVMALITAAIGFIPMEGLFNSIVGGGALHE
ncbi:hypothetical protein FITA111629_05355 [Filibacter tadaridae]|uniref:Yip1 domain protein n=1 Tax=Filibacter tadaridae TaxID=2483811 RepID=A0A3P5WUV4_9BACL|nr:hypothetical protein [Filibacter tadaridae]VDC19086.1 hypothetical protein FILTAD_00205 [Filibacter tadaridae]